jgi:hypothetical protein
MCQKAANQEAATTSQVNPPSCIPSNEVCLAAYAHAAQHLHPTILNHSLRVFLYAQALSLSEKSPYSNPSHLESTLLLVTSLFHDIGTSTTYDTGPTRFEIEGGDAATAFLSQYSEISQEWKHHVWTAIALHTTPQIAERIHPLARLLRLAVKIDFHGVAERETLTRALREVDAFPRDAEAVIAQAEKAFPRAEIEKVLGDCVVEQALKTEGKAPMVSWPGALLKSKREDMAWQGINRAF